MTPAIIAADILQFGNNMLSHQQIKELTDLVPIKDIAAEIIKRGAPFNNRELEILIGAAGNMDGQSFDTMDDDDILNKYAQFVINQHYTYKPEAQQIDPRIDINQEHIGPMAQDLEKVNPAVVKQDPSGYKTVDTGRLALMNAGAIADLARQIQGLKRE